jgi:hypothetical protein
MRRMLVVALAGALLLLSTTVQAELLLNNDGPLSAKAAQEKFYEAWRACSAENPGSSQTVLYACINKKIERFKLKAVNT